MVKVLWKSDNTVNDIGSGVQILDVDGDVIIEGVFGNKMSLKQKLKAIVNIISGKEVIISSVYGGKYEKFRGFGTIE